MKRLLVALCLVYMCVAEPGWLSSFSDYDTFNDDVFAKAYSEAKTSAANMRQKIKDEEAQREKNLPSFEEGSLGSFASKLIGSAKKATATAISGVRNTATELTKSVIAAAANAGVDLLIAEYKLLAGTTGIGAQLALPEIQTSGYGCELKASGGYFSSISSLEKCGKINVIIVDSETAILEIPMKFNEMRVVYEQVDVKAFFFGTSGSFTINIAKNNLIIRLRLGMDSTCALNVDKVEIKELDGFSIDFKGMGSYANAFSEMLINYMKENISRYIQDAVDSNLREALANNSLICSNFVPV